jgi:hypothetical protein
VLTARVFELIDLQVEAGSSLRAREACARATGTMVDLDTEQVNIGKVPENLIDNKRKLLQYAWTMQQQGYASDTIRSNSSCLRALIARGANLADPGEALKLRWIDINASNNTITINRPVKGHNPRQLKVSSKLIAMLNTLPKDLALQWDKRPTIGDKTISDISYH